MKTLALVEQSYTEDPKRPFIKESGRLTRKMIATAAADLNTVITTLRARGTAAGSIFAEDMGPLWVGVLVQDSLPITTFIRMTAFINANREFARQARDGQDGCSTCDADPDKTESHKEQHSYRDNQLVCPHGPGGSVKQGCPT